MQPGSKPGLLHPQLDTLTTRAIFVGRLLSVHFNYTKASSANVCFNVFVINNTNM